MKPIPFIPGISNKVKAKAAKFKLNVMIKSATLLFQQIRTNKAKIDTAGIYEKNITIATELTDVI